MDKPDDPVWVLNDQAQVSFFVSAPVPGKGLQNIRYAPKLGSNLRTFVQVFKESGLLDSLGLLIEHPSVSDCPEIPTEHLEVFRRLNLLVPSGQVSERVVFIPFLSQYPELTPGSQSHVPQQLRFNPSIELQLCAESAPADSVGLLDWAQISALPLLWLSQPGHQARFFYCLEPQMAEWLKSRAQEQISYLSREARQTLYQAGVLLDAYKGGTQGLEQGELDRQTFLAEHQYLVMRQLIPPFWIGALRAYIRQLYQRGYFQLGDAQVKERYVFYNEPLMHFLHQQIYQELKPLFQTETLSPIKPSYNFLAIYQAGAELLAHTDRAQCLWNMSLVLDMPQEVPTEDVWPFYLAAPEGDVEVKLNLGDAILYPGSRFKHWRGVYNQSVAVVMFHFVAYDFEDVLG